MLQLSILSTLADYLETRCCWRGQWTHPEHITNVWDEHQRSLHLGDLPVPVNVQSLHDGLGTVQDSLLVNLNLKMRPLIVCICRIV